MTQHARHLCPSPTPRVYWNSCPLSQWCYPTISSSVAPFFSCLHSFPASGSFHMSHFFTSGSQSIGVPASTSVLPKNIQDSSPLGWTGWISLQSKGLSGVFSNTPYPCCFFEHSVMSSSLQPHGLWPDRLLCQWDFSGKNTRVGCHFFLQGIFLTQDLDHHLLHLLHSLGCSLPLSHLGSYNVIVIQVLSQWTKVTALWTWFLLSYTQHHFYKIITMVWSLI